MNTISFAWTTPALLAGAKTCTRRNWDKRYAESFNRRIMTAEPLECWALDKDTRWGGKRVAVIQLLSVSWSNEYPDSDWFAEGFDWLEKNGLKCGKVEPRALWNVWRLDRPWQWVVRFQFIMDAP